MLVRALTSSGRTYDPEDAQTPKHADTSRYPHLKIHRPCIKHCREGECGSTEGITSEEGGRILRVREADVHVNTLQYDKTCSCVHYKPYHTCHPVDRCPRCPCCQDFINHNSILLLEDAYRKGTGQLEERILQLEMELDDAPGL